MSSSVLYIGQIPYDWDEPTVKLVVCGTGRVVDVRLGFDYAGKNKGFCFVEYATGKDAHRAMGLLREVKLMNPQTKQVKKLRIESSKEQIKGNGPSENKTVMKLDHSRLPPYVQLPAELAGSGGASGASGGGHLFMGPGTASPAPGGYGGGASGPPTVPVMPPRFSTATKTLPQPPSIPLGVPDKISDTLSQIPPALLIELVAQLKNIVNGQDHSRAYEVFRLSPQLATAAAQALLLMGFVDAEVIQESMKAAAQAPPPPVAPAPANNGYGYSPYGQPMPSSLPAPPVLRWPNLPAHTQAKLAQMAPDQAELIAQVLALPADQIGGLPPDKQTMVVNLRSQYL